jgi:hypothetical protein
METELNLQKVNQMQTITKIFEYYDHAKQAVSELEAAGISSSAISLVANKRYVEDDSIADENSEAGTGAGIGAAVGGAAGLLTGLGIMAIPGVGPVVAAGWLASTALGAAAGGAMGGIVGSLVSSGVPDEHAHVYSEALRRGASLVSVKAEDYQAERVHAILDKNQPLDPVELGTEYRKTGWDKFDPETVTYSSEQRDPNLTRRVS